MGNLQSRLTKIRALIKPRIRADFDSSLATFNKLAEKLTNLGEIPDDLRNDSREYDSDLVKDCQKEAKRLQGLKWRRGVNEETRQRFENAVNEIYALAALPLIGQLFRQLHNNRLLREGTEFETVQNARESLERDLDLVRDAAERFASIAHSSAYKVEEIEKAQSLLAEFERGLSNEIDVFVQQHGSFPEIGTLTSLTFARRGTTRSGGSQSDVSLNDRRPAAHTALRLREAFTEPGPSSGIGFSQGF